MGDRQVANPENALQAQAGQLPLRERTWEPLTLALYRAGRQAES
jgi:hypothetical protein